MDGGCDKTDVLENGQSQKKSKESKKNKSKDSTLDSVRSIISGLSQEEQIKVLLTKYSEIIDEQCILKNTCQSLERTAEQAKREKNKIESEHGKAVLTRSRLESLCRELQRQNKLIKDDSMTRLKEEEERRKEVSNKFNSTLSEITNLMEENSVNNAKLKEENQKMASKLQNLISQHDAREDHVEKMIKQREIEAQLAQAKLAKFQFEITEEKEKMLSERKSILEEMTSLQNKLQEKSLTEITLRTQLNSYTEKFQELQGTLEKSNSIFNGFKKEMDEMNKLIKKLQKETKMWKEKYENSNVALYQMFNERTQMEEKIKTQEKQNNQLQGLCRALQEQVREMRSQLKVTEADISVENSAHEISKQSQANETSQIDSNGPNSDTVSTSENKCNGLSNHALPVTTELKDNVLTKASVSEDSSLANSISDLALGSYEVVETMNL